MLGKKMKGSGLSNIIMEAGLISSGSVAGVMQGKHYDRVFHCHKVALESLLVTEVFPTQEHPLIAVSNEARKKIDALLQHPSDTSLSEVLEDADVKAIIYRYSAFRQEDLGKTAQLWLSYMNYVHLLLALITSVKTNNYVLYAETTK